MRLGARADRKDAHAFQRDGNGYSTMSRLLVTGIGGPAGIALGEQLATRAAGGADLDWVGLDIRPIRDGNYAHAPLPERSVGARTLDVEAMYNVARFRPRYEAKLGSPLLLGPAVVE